MGTADCLSRASSEAAFYNFTLGAIFCPQHDSAGSKNPPDARFTLRMIRCAFEKSGAASRPAKTKSSRERLRRLRLLPETLVPRVRMPKLNVASQTVARNESRRNESDRHLLAIEKRFAPNLTRNRLAIVGKVVLVLSRTDFTRAATRAEKSR